MAAVETVSELEIHYRAYLQIFQAVLKKKITDPARLNASLADLRKFLEQNVQNPDAFIDHIPEFARRMGVDAGQLGAFVGANFLKALSAAKQQLEAQSNAAAAPSAPAAVSAPAPSAGTTVTGTVPPVAAKERPILKEIQERFGSLVQPSERFVSVDWGLVKLVSAKGEIPARSFAFFETGVMPEPIAVAAPVVEEAKPAAAAPVRSQAAAPVMIKETSIIKEILEKFGSHLDIPGKLVPKEYDEFQADVPAAPVPVAAVSPSSTAGPAAAAPAMARAPVPSAPMPKEISIIKEILNRFGSVLDVHAKLVPKSGLDGGFVSDDDDDDDADAGSGSAPATASHDIPRLTIAFVEYLDIVKALQEFQKSGDQNGYKQWLGGLNVPGKAIVGLRNLEGKARRGADVYWPDEYYNLSNHTGTRPESIQLLHEDTRRYEQVQRLLTRFTDSIRQMDPPTLQAARTIWPQIRLLFNEPGDEKALVSRMKIVLLQVVDQGRKAKIQEILEPLVRQAAGYLAGEGVP